MNINIPTNDSGLQIIICLKRKFTEKNIEIPINEIKMKITDIDKAYHILTNYYSFINNNLNISNNMNSFGVTIDYIHKSNIIKQLVFRNINWFYITEKYTKYAKVLVKYHRSLISKNLRNGVEFNKSFFDTHMNHLTYQNYTLNYSNIKVLGTNFNHFNNKIKILYEFNIDHNISDKMYKDYPHTPCILYIETIIKKIENSYRPVIIGYRIFNNNYLSLYGSY